MMDKDLRNVIEEELHKRGWEEAGVLTDYMVLTCQQNFSAKGEGEARYGYLLPDGEIPIHRVLGLIDITRIQVESEVKR